MLHISRVSVPVALPSISHVFPEGVCVTLVMRTQKQAVTPWLCGYRVNLTTHLMFDTEAVCDSGCQTKAELVKSELNKMILNAAHGPSKQLVLKNVRKISICNFMANIVIFYKVKVCMCGLYNFKEDMFVPSILTNWHIDRNNRIMLNNAVASCWGLHKFKPVTDKSLPE